MLLLIGRSDWAGCVWFFYGFFFLTTSTSVASLDVGLVADLNWEVEKITRHYVRQDFFFLMLSWYED